MRLLTATRERQGDRDGDTFPAGAVVGRRLDNLVWRSEPSELG